MKTSLIVIFLLAFIFGCETKNKTNDKRIKSNKNSFSQKKSKIIKRWYTQSQVDLGKQVFANNCIECHGEKGQGITENWKKPLSDSSYPPPPLNGMAHTWHHPMSNLKKTINNGGIAFGGKMPGFKDKLKKEDILAVIAYFQSLWSDHIYSQWIGRNGLK